MLYQQQACQSCHSIDGSRVVGPTFKGLYGAERVFTDGTSATADDNYLRTAILQPADQIVEGYMNQMPAAYGGLSERELTALIAYIEEQQ